MAANHPGYNEIGKKVAEKAKRLARLNRNIDSVNGPTVTELLHQVGRRHES